MDSIRLQGVTLFPRLGVTKWEKMGVQKVACDVVLFCDLAAAARTDRISAAIDYQEVYGVIHEVAKARKYHLIESLAHAIIFSLIERFPKVQKAGIRLRKTSLPFDANLECVEVEMERSR